MNPIQGKRILLGVTGSIAAYKAVELASKMTQYGAEVEILLTPSAEKFVTPLTFQSVTGRSAYTDSALWGAEAHILHVSLSKPADLFLIAPATANTIAKLAHGLADNLLTITALAAECPLVIAPAMDGGMYQSVPHQENLALLSKRGVAQIGPEEGRFASGLVGKGRMTEPLAIMERIRYLLSRSGRLQGKKIVVTAGGTQEPLDPVRVLTNRSSGKQGYAIAQAALDLGADVILISAPTACTAPYGAELVSIRTAAEMRSAVQASCRDADTLIMAAAVADFRPKEPASEKIKKDTVLSQIALEPTIDILKEVAEGKGRTSFPKQIIGFAAETADLEKHAQQKLAAKHMDFIVANNVSIPDSGFEVDTNQVTIIDANGGTTVLPMMSKYQVAERILEKII